jgi:hypothetical protein
VNRVNVEWFGLVAPLFWLGLGAGWTLRGWWDRKHRADRVVGNIRELHPEEGHQ